MADLFVVIVNNDWSKVLTAETSGDAITDACDEWRRLFSDGEDQGLIESVVAKRLHSTQDTK